METTKLKILKMLNEAGGSTTEYPFIETGQVHRLDELVEEGFLVRITRDGDLDEIKITDRGREFLARQSRAE